MSSRMGWKLVFCIAASVILLSSGVAKYEKIKVEGIASNAKAGAIVHTDDDKSYYISGKEAWGYRYNRKVKVRGRLEVIEYPDRSNDSVLVAGLARKPVIHYPFIRLVW